MKNLLLVPLVFLLTFFLFLPSAFSQYQFDTWNTDNGLPQNSVQAIIQTHDGYLWLSTSDGLVRFDGVRFTIFNKANTKGIRSNRFTDLCEVQAHSLWAGTEDSNSGSRACDDGALRHGAKFDCRINSQAPKKVTALSQGAWIR